MTTCEATPQHLCDVALDLVTTGRATWAELIADLLTTAAGDVTRRRTVWLTSPDRLVLR